MTALAQPIEITEERTEEERYRLYEERPCERCFGAKKLVRVDQGGLVRCPNCRGKGRDLHLIATTPDPEGIGVALVQLAQDRVDAAEQDGKTYETPIIGVLDGIERRWITGLWKGGPR